jgi:multidrug efflux system membrane fusion protein
MKATFPNADDVLWPGLSVSTQLLLKTLKNVVVAPNDAIQRGPHGLYAFVVASGDRVTARPVTASYEGESGTVVANGLQAGEEVVVAGQYRLTPNARIAAREQKNPTPAARHPNAQAFAVQAKSTLSQARRIPAPQKGP